MNNRLPLFIRAGALSVVLAYLLCPFKSDAQQSKFNFSYNGPTTFSVGPGCTGTLQDAIQPLPSVSSKMGATIVVSQLEETLTGWGYTDPVPKNTTVNVHWYVEDNMGNSAVFNTFVMAFEDNTPPVFDLFGVDPVITVNSIIQVPPAPNIPVVDNCDGALTPSFVQSPAPDTCQGGSFTRTWTATDQEGNTGVFTQIINVFGDTLPPFINVAPQNGSAPCEQLSVAYPAWRNTQIANFQAVDPSGIKAYTNNAPPSFPPGCAQTLTFTFRAEDNCGLKSSRTAQFVTSDPNPPVLNSGPRDTVAYCSPSGNQVVKLSQWINKRGFLNAIDACTDPAYMQYDMRINGVLRDSAQVIAAFLASFDGSCKQLTVGSVQYNKVVGSVQVNFTVKDACGNSIPGGAAVFAAIDTFPPTINGPATTTETCSGTDDQIVLQNWINNKASALLIDECTNASWLEFTWKSSTGDIGNGGFNFGPYPSIPANECNWYVDVTFVAADGCGNIRRHIARFQLTDNISPTFTGTTPVDTLYCPVVVPIIVPADWSDNCDAAVSLTQNGVVSDSLCGGQYTLTVTWTATDDCGNTANLVHVFAVRDTTSPTVTLVPADVTLSCNSVVLPAPPVLGTGLQAADACGSISGYTYSDVSGQNPDPGVCGHYNYTITRVFVVSDDCGNTATAAQLIAVEDNTPPVFSGFTDTTAVCESEPMMPPPNALDECSGPTAAPMLKSQVIINGPCDDTYTLRLLWEAQDVCGNRDSFVQDIHVSDTVRPTLVNIPPNVTVACNAIPDLPSNISGNDNCDESVLISFTESEVRNPNLNSCEHWSNYLIRREWTVSDNCGNNRNYTQTIAVTDNLAPVLQVQDTVSSPASPAMCSVDMLIPPPLSLYDQCSVQQQFVELRDTMPIVNTSGQPDISVACDTIRFQWASPVTPPISPVVSDAAMTIFLDNADSETDEERLEIWGEDGIFLGFTQKTPFQCSSSVTNLLIPAAYLNAWLPDGDLIITLAPIGTGPGSLNALCPGRQVRATVGIPVAIPYVDIDLAYSIDGGPMQSYPPSASSTLGVGLHTIIYEATDCAGNSSTATMVLRVEDLESPVVNTPAPMTAYTSPSDCEASVNLPFPGLSENCSFSDDLARSSAAVTLTFEFDPNAQLVPKDVTLNILGLVPNSVAGGTLRILHRGDNETTGEFFQIYDESDNLLGVTSLGTAVAQCTDFHETEIWLSAAQINTWAANGSAQIKLKSNRDASNFSHFIGPCGSLNGASQDGISAVQAIIEYNFAAVTYEITDYLGQPVADGLLNGSLTNVQLPPGNYSVTYRVLDANGNAGMTTFPLSVQDTVSPVARCENTIIFTNPSGATTYNLTPGEVDDGSTDNCTGPGLSFGLSQTTFTCNQAGAVIPVTLTVTDTSGNSSNCTATVRIETIDLAPSYTQNICMGDTAQLFANPPIGAVYTFTWNGPMFGSGQQNPFIFNTSAAKEGTYSVTITGPTGCTAEGQVSVDFNEMPQKPAVTVQDNSLCYGENVVLVTNTVGGANVSYNWYRGLPPNGTFLEATTVPTYQVNLPAVGTYQYYLIVAVGGCSSIPSDHREVTVFSAPEASVNQSNITLCAGQALVLGTKVAGSGVSYAWSGPTNFASTVQNPTVSTNVDTVNSGVYRLLITQNGCTSSPVFVNVFVNPRPAAPLISGAGAVCLSDSLKLTTDINGAGFVWKWVSPAFDTTTINGINQLLISPVDMLDSGFWRVFVVQQGCASTVSSGHLLKVLSKPDVLAFANTPLCQDTLLCLSATTNIDNILFSWTGPNGFVSSLPDPCTGGITGPYMVIGRTIGASCADTAMVNVVVVPSPVITDITNNAPSCAPGNTSAQLQPSVFSPFGPFTYAWRGPNGMIFSQEAMPLINDIGSDNNGAYTLIIRDTFGCPSLPAVEVIDVDDVPDMPVVAAVAPVCEGDDVLLQVSNAFKYVGANVTYTWYRPLLGPINTVFPELALANISKAQAGTYRVTVKIGDCVSDSSQAVSVVVNSIPPAPSVAAPAVVCTGETLQLFAPAGADAYIWTGPNGWSATVPNPVIFSVDSSDAGFYNVQIRLNGCLSPVGIGATILVKPRPNTPVILPGQSVCLDQPGSVLQLQISPSSTTAGAMYTWVSNMSGDTLSGPSFATNLTISDLNLFSPGPNGVFTLASLDGCSSTPSAVVLVMFDTVPDLQAFAGPDRIVCSGASVNLEGAAPSIGTGLWTQVSGPNSVINDPSLATTLVNGLAATNIYRYRWTLSNGACKNYSIDDVTIQVVPFEQAIAIDNFIDTCYVESIVITGQPGTTATGQWSQPQVQGQLGVTITDPDEAVTSVDNLGTGVYYFFWTLQNEGCIPSTDTVVVRVVGSVAFAGNDQSICSSDSCSGLNASALPANETGRWSSPNPALRFASPTSPNTTVCGLVPGPNLCVWTTNEGLCGDKSRDTVLLDFEVTPTTLNDTVVVPFGIKVTFDVVFNDILPNQYKVEIVQQPAHGKFEDIGNGVYAYQPDIQFAGTDVVVYKVCNINCVEACDFANVTLLVQEAGDCVIPTIITPNNDGTNDEFFVPCLNADVALDNEVTIFNRWGDEVFHASPYGNDWQGTFNGEPLPAGTYFYVVKFNGDAGTQSGFLILQR